MPAPEVPPPAAILIAGATLLAFACSGQAPLSTDDPAPSVPESAWIVDSTDALGLDFVHESGARGGLHMPEIIGSGGALFDADADGDLDVYLVNGSFAFETEAVEARPTNRLYLRDSDGRLRDATSESGLGDPGYGLGVAIGDVDNDGDADVYVTNFGPDRLYLNRGDGVFEEATQRSGIDVGGFSCSAVFCDYDLDGHLDLYVTQYVRYDENQFCRNSSGQRDYCNPRAFNPAPDVLLHNDGDGTFADVSAEAGLRDAAGAGLGVVCEDFNDDGRPDFYAANDQYPNHLWVNNGDGTFRDQALLLGAAYNLEGREEAGMGVLAADLDGDVDLDLFVTHLGGQTNTFYRSLGGGLFEDATGVAGLAASSLPLTGFGAVALDVELDGDLDLLVANGRVFRATADQRAVLAEPWSYFAEPNLFYLNDGEGRFTANDDLAAAFTRPVEVSRGLAVGDVDDDGDVDVLLTNTQGRARLFLNEAPRQGRWLIVRAVDPASKRDAIGARVVVTSGEQRVARTITRSFSYLSSSDPRAHFGLGDAGDVARVDVRWPDGRRESFRVEGLDRLVTVRRGDGSPQ